MLYFMSKDYINSRIIVVVIVNASRFAMKTPAPGMKAYYYFTGDNNLDLRTSGISIPNSLRNSGPSSEASIERIDRTNHIRDGSLVY